MFKTIRKRRGSDVQLKNLSLQLGVRTPQREDCIVDCVHCTVDTVHYTVHIKYC